MTNVIDFTAARQRIERLAAPAQVHTYTVPRMRPTLLEQLRIRLTQEEIAELVTVTLAESK